MNTCARTRSFLALLAQVIANLPPVLMVDCGYPDSTQPVRPPQVILLWLDLRTCCWPVQLVLLGHFASNRQEHNAAANVQVHRCTAAMIQHAFPGGVFGRFGLDRASSLNRSGPQGDIWDRLTHLLSKLQPASGAVDTGKGRM